MTTAAGGVRSAICIALLLTIVGAPARADDAEQLAGLFVQSCLRFAGDMQGLRQWAGQLGLKPLPPRGQAAFLQAQKGIAYDATSADGKFVVISGDDGACSAVAERGNPDLLAGRLETALTRLGIAFTVAADRADPSEPRLHHREYDAHKEKRGWRIVVSTGSADSGAHPMLTAIPE